MNTLDYNEVINKLKMGNERFASGNPIHPHQSEKRRLEVAEGQNPIAIVLTCSDSRVPPEIIFDHGLGDLFVICTAGNIIDDIVIGSIEFAVTNLGVKILIVMGHENCGAVAATIKGVSEHGHINSVINAIQPAVDSVKDQSGNLIENAVKANVEMVIERLISTEPILSGFVIEDKLKIVGAIYNLKSGLVEFL